MLVPDAPVIISSSNRCFPTKAVAIWRSLGGDDQARLIELYLRYAGFSAVAAYGVVPEGSRSDPLWAVIGRNMATTDGQAVSPP